MEKVAWFVVLICAFFLLWWIATGVHMLWRLFLQHCFREYEKWQQRNLPSGCLMLTNIHITRGGDLELRVDGGNGYCNITWRKGGSFETFLQQFSDRIRELAKAAKLSIPEDRETGKREGLMTLKMGNTPIWFPLDGVDRQNP